VPINKTDLLKLDPEGTGRVNRQRFTTWMANYPSRTRFAREYLKINNAPSQVYADELVGPLQVVLERRSKYIAVNQLSFDYLDMGPLISELEGEYSGGSSNDLISAIGQSDIAQWGMRLDMQESPVQSRMSLSPNELGFDSASYWNGRAWERHQEAKAEYQYGADCIHIHGTKEGCPESYAHSPYLSMSQEYYDNFELVKTRAAWIRKGAVQSRYPCFGDRRLCNKYIVYPQIRPFETASEGVNLWNPQRQYFGIWGVTDERTRLIQRRNEQTPQTQLCTNITTTNEITVNQTINSTSWRLVNVTVNSTTLYCQQQSACFNHTTLKNVTINGASVLKNVTELKCQKVLDESNCPGQMVNVTVLQNITYANATSWQLMNVTVSKCIISNSDTSTSTNSGTSSSTNSGTTNNNNNYGMRL
jgi:hypothetical protein